MKENYDFTKGKRGAVSPNHKKIRISIRLDRKVVEWFKNQIEQEDGGSYQALMNQVLLNYVANKGEPIENVLRRVIREEMHPPRSFAKGMKTEGPRTANPG